MHVVDPAIERYGCGRTRGGECRCVAGEAGLASTACGGWNVDDGAMVERGEDYVGRVEVVRDNEVREMRVGASARCAESVRYPDAFDSCCYGAEAGCGRAGG